MIFTVPDFCWAPPPAPHVTPPVPFSLFADLGNAKTVAKDVRLNRKPAFVFKASKTNRTTGDEPAVSGRKGVLSSTATKPAWPVMHSSSVKIRKRRIIRAGDMFHMNNKFKKKLPPKPCISCKAAAGLEPQLLFRPRRYWLAWRGLEYAWLPAHLSVMRRDWPILTIRAVCSRCWKSMKMMRSRYCSKANRIWFSKKPGRALCHCFARRFDSAAFCAFGGRGRRFGRRFHPLPAGGGGRRQRQPPAFRLSRWPVCRNTSSTATAGCSH